MRTFLSRTDLGDTRVLSVSANRWGQNCHLVIHVPTLDTTIIDPGYGHEELVRQIRSQALRPVAIAVTHAHFDHVASAHPLQEEFPGLPFWMHRDEAAILEKVNTYAMFLQADRVKAPKDIRFLGGAIEFRGGEISVHPYPGHTPGGCIFSFQNTIFTGDLLIKDQKQFKKLPGFDPQRLQESVRQVFEKFKDDTIVFPGHGKVTSIGNLKSVFADHGAGKG